MVGSVGSNFSGKSSQDNVSTDRCAKHTVQLRFAVFHDVHADSPTLHVNVLQAPFETHYSYHCITEIRVDCADTFEMIISIPRL